MPTSTSALSLALRNGPYTAHTKFGHCVDENYRCVSRHDYANPIKEKHIEEMPYMGHKLIWPPFDLQE
ncbi:hypothetical protein CONPUDRAFT_155434 [Coniophora puteana RWD-64-598 SS2]|uniref:Uncharacterized protein n=1 Tax=Coniophora puteana (strain RWD-64-598) TaxID=741705 RepID=A0A5M3MM15_CONPW|nr:uncharacterized protein CONPUDRAFT_155434 [Coniophora puteana RWD-64-598 SS2]EIW80067.1 hypothetical protein CONPUDRAFT_155434 [Coniophora puteana RWD-64-598 SS2]